MPRHEAMGRVQCGGNGGVEGEKGVGFQRCEEKRVRGASSKREREDREGGRKKLEMGENGLIT